MFETVNVSEIETKDMKPEMQSEDDEWGNMPPGRSQPLLTSQTDRFLLKNKLQVCETCVS